MCQIVHIHGSLGPLPWQHQSRDLASDVPYDSMREEASGEVLFARSEFSEYQWFETARSSIRVIHETGEKTAQLQQACEWICDCDRLYFLGFGYHPSNLQRLEIRFLPPRTKHIRGTMYGLSCERRQHIWNLVHELGTVSPGEALINTDIYSFLYDHVSFTMG